MTRVITDLLAAAAIVLLAAGPAASATAAAINAPTIVTEPIDISDTHQEPDGSTTFMRLLGTRTFFTFPDGRYMLRESYTDHQVLTDPSGALLFESRSEASVKVITEGERTVLFRSVSDTTVTFADGTTCTSSSTFIVANDKVVKAEQTEPICS